MLREMRSYGNQLINIFALWRFASLLIHDVGPYNIILKFRKLLGINLLTSLETNKQVEVIEKLNLSPYENPPKYWSDNEVGKLFICMNCLSIWISAFYVLFFEKEDKLKKLFAYSGLMILIEKYYFSE